ncbi:MAG: acyltransferase [Chloroflexota bacterium]|nr:MAG: acyltransferase [Chloroflexota bacterium]
MRADWQRDLPFGELVSDRWRRAADLGFGEGASIYDSSYVYGDVSVGPHTWIGPFTLLDGSGGLIIGEHCSISAGVHIYTHDTVAWAVSGGRVAAQRSPVVIGGNTYIGSQAIVARGVTIGDHCVIGAGSFVNRSIPPYTVAMGTPCRVVGRVEVDASGRVTLHYETESGPNEAG